MGIGMTMGQTRNLGRIVIGQEYEPSPCCIWAATHVVDRGHAELERERREALVEVLLLLLGVELILVGGTRVLGD
jgi:hypothetical protein